MCLNAILVSIEMGQFSHVTSYVSKAELTPEALEPVTVAKLHCAAGLAYLEVKKYKLAARKFLEVGTELGNDYTEVIALQDLATYGGLCALASFDRTELKAYLSAICGAQKLAFISSLLNIGIWRLKLLALRTEAIEILIETSRRDDGHSNLASKPILPTVLLVQSLPHSSACNLLLLSLRFLRNLCAREAINQRSFMEHDGVKIVSDVISCMVLGCDDSEYALSKLGYKCWQMFQWVKKDTSMLCGANFSLWGSLKLLGGGSVGCDANHSPGDVINAILSGGLLDLLLHLLGELELPPTICKPMKQNENQSSTPPKKSGILHLLQRFVTIEDNPFFREWGIWSVRNLLEGNVENQKVVADLELQGSVNVPEFAGLGHRVEMDSNTRCARLINVS
ncbi:hypothetical protein Nepgr_002384 [Nepenthes gracilis]|uniref:Ataxin-10 domain-containing protein n=1 Tax=Nepenthes gracilis TaxID=150966 RepID=A0AAD3RYE6_NEPGR|nr:hypothetical protein Nepgr_002384 [Nepenthes gracilis]